MSRTRIPHGLALVLATILLAGCPPHRSPPKPAAKDAGAAAAPDAGAQAGATGAKAADAGAAPAAYLGPPRRTAAQLVPGKGHLYAIFDTSMGKMVCILYEKAAPLTVANFVGLATGQHQYRDPRTDALTKGKYYDGTIFHRVIPHFMIQGGDPTGTGRGGPGYKFRDEQEKLTFDKPGRLAMANAGPNTNGSQFFITEGPSPHLNHHYTIFGQLLSGLSVEKKIARVKTTVGNRPVKPVVLEHVKIVRARRPPKG